MRRLGDKRKEQEKQEKQRLQPFHAYVATPAYDGKVDTDYSQSLAETAFCCPLWGVHLTAGVMGNGAFIEMARNVFVKFFLEKYTDATHLFFIDADLKFEARAFIALVRANLPICAGVYRRRQEPEDYPVRWTEHPEQGGLWVEDDGWVMCDRVPTGFLCIRRDVVEEMSAEAHKVTLTDQGVVPWLFETQLTDDGRFMGEDFVFCDKYRAKYNRPIPVWADLDFRHGGYDCNFHQYLSRLIAENNQKQTMSGAA